MFLEVSKRQDYLQRCEPVISQAQLTGGKVLEVFGEPVEARGHARWEEETWMESTSVGGSRESLHLPTRIGQHCGASRVVSGVSHIQSPLGLPPTSSSGTSRARIESPRRIIGCALVNLQVDCAKLPQRQILRAIQHR